MSKFSTLLRHIVSLFCIVCLVMIIVLQFFGDFVFEFCRTFSFMRCLNIK